MLKEKGESIFKKLKRFVENGYDHKLKTLRTNRDGEFLSQNFSNFCEEEGIKRQLTTLCTLQQDGVVYRKNRIIMYTTRSLLKSMQILKIFWGEAMRHAVYLLNRLPTKTLDTCIPYEAWFNKTPHFEYLTVIPKEREIEIEKETKNRKSREGQILPLQPPKGSK